MRHFTVNLYAHRALFRTAQEALLMFKWITFAAALNIQLLTVCSD